VALVAGRIGPQGGGVHRRGAVPPLGRRAAAALRTDPAGYERHVIGFLDRALR